MAVSLKPRTVVHLYDCDRLVGYQVVTDTAVDQVNAHLAAAELVRAATTAGVEYTHAALTRKGQLVRSIPLH